MLVFSLGDALVRRLDDADARNTTWVTVLSLGRCGSRCGGGEKKKELVNIELVSPTNALVARNACTGVHPNVDGMDEKASTETQGALKSTSCIAAFQPKHAAARYSSTRSLLLPRCLGRHWGQ